MRIALCISGQPRSLIGGCSIIKERLIQPSNITDIFVHTWYHQDLNGKPFNSSQPHLDKNIGRWMPNSDEYLRLQLNPIKLVADNQDDMRQYDHLKDVEGRANQKALASMFHSVTLANELKSNYEKENGFKYDIVIRTRIDHIYHKAINIAELYDPNQKDAVFVPRTHQYMRDNHFLTSNSGLRYASCSETFMFGSSENMDKACSLSYDFEKIYNDIYPENYAEQYIGYQVIGVNKLRVLSVDAPYDIYRGE